MASYVVRSPYFLETANGNIELSKGMYICLVHRKGLLPKSTVPRRRSFREDSVATTRRLSVSRRKIIRRSRRNTRAQIAGSVVLRKGRENYTFELFDDVGLLPPTISKLYVSLRVIEIPVDFDNDCSSDEEEIQRSIQHMLMSLCIAAYDQRLST